MIDRLARCGGLLWLVLVAASCGPSRAVWKEVSAPEQIPISTKLPDP